MMDLDEEIPFGLTLHPTPEEFSDPRGYIESLDKNKSLAQYGMIKVNSHNLCLLSSFLDSSSSWMEAQRSPNKGGIGKIYCFKYCHSGAYR